MSGAKSKEQFWQEQTKEQLIIFLKNAECIEDILRKRLFLLTGCEDFGTCDGMNGSCVKCSYDNEELWEKCEELWEKCKLFSNRVSVEFVTATEDKK